MIDGTRIREWGEEAIREGDPLLGVLLIHLSTLYHLGDFRSVELARNFAGLRAREAVAAGLVQEDWQPETEIPV